MHPRLQRDRLLLPMHQVGTGGMAPVHRVPLESVRVVLVVEVVETVVVQGRVDVVHPSAARAEVVLAAVVLLVVRRGIRELGVVLDLSTSGGHGGDAQRDRRQHQHCTGAPACPSAHACRTPSQRLAHDRQRDNVVLTFHVTPITSRLSSTARIGPDDSARGAARRVGPTGLSDERDDAGLGETKGSTSDPRSRASGAASRSPARGRTPL